MDCWNRRDFFQQALGESSSPHKLGSTRRAFTVVELLVVIAIVGLLAAMVLPAVQCSREAARRSACSLNLKQLGIALQNHDSTHGTLPSGYFAKSSDSKDTTAWGWATYVLPFVEESALYQRLDPDSQSLGLAAGHADVLPLLRVHKAIFRCPSDTSDTLSHVNRQIMVYLPVEVASAERATNVLASFDIAAQSVLQIPLLVAHIFHPDPTANGPAMRRELMQLGTSNYVACLGSNWDAKRSNWADVDFAGNGLFGRNSRIRLSRIPDGTSYTIAIGERSEDNYAAVWAGVNSWQRCTFFDNQMVLGTAYYPLNEPPIAANFDCDGTGSAGFSSRHSGGANFLFAEGSVRFLSDSIDSQRPEPDSPLGVYQCLAARDDGSKVELP
jgi:prepilin-type N-terminal cleavage/methylation domain-containing protein/prepilin-type processing-associated H-X9-DG protein